MTTPADRLVTLPTRRLFVSAWIACLVIGGGWMATAYLLGHGWVRAYEGGFGTVGVGLASTLAILVLRPWKPRSLAIWPMVWVAASGLRMVATVGAGYLLYSSPLASGEKVIWMAIGLAYAATMYAETNVYARTMRAYGPGHMAESDTSKNPAADSVSPE